MNKNALKTTYQTDWAALESMSEEDIDYSDIPPLTEEFFNNASLRISVRNEDSITSIICPGDKVAATQTKPSVAG